MARRNGLSWIRNPFWLKGRGAMLVIALEAGLAKRTAGFAQEVQQYMQENAPWEDQTGAARDGLTAIGEQRLTKYTIYLFHTVEYGIWLEVRWDGKYAIIQPTIEAMGPRLMGSLSIGGLAGDGD